MPTRDTAPIGAPCWIDLLTSDTDRAQTFYTGLFGWEAGEASAQFGGYFMFTRHGVPVAGGVPNQPDWNLPDGWNTYLAVTDAKASAAAAAANGGQQVGEIMQIADLGSMANLLDPGGAAIGIWQPDTFHGFGVLIEPGAPAWFELHTTSYAKAVSFYEHTFGWDVHVAGDTPEFRYSTFGEGERAMAGIMDATPFGPGAGALGWRTYIAVEDSDAVAAKAVQLGGSVAQAPENTPYNRLAVLADPTGARISIIGPNIG